MNVGFIGLGKLGQPCAEVLAGIYTVYGFDIQQKEIPGVNQCASIQEVAAKAEIIFIALPTPHHPDYGGERPTTDLEPKDFDYGALKSCVQELSHHVGTKHTVVIISTVLPGTIRRELAPMLQQSKLIYNPYLIAMGTVKDDFCYPEMIIIGTADGASDTARQLRELYYPLVARETRYEIGTWEEAECIKIFYNTFISAKIGIVNMIQDVAERNGYIDVDVVTGALAKSDKRITGPAYMRAGMGDGGPCHPRDNIALSWLSSELKLGYDFFSSIMKAREKQAEALAQKLMSYNLPIVILGKSYKPGVSLTDGSYALLVGHYIGLNNHPYYYDNGPIQESAYTYLLGHPTHYPDSVFTKDSIVVDPWRSFLSQRQDLRVVHYGNTRQKS
jgi:UDPglucose 6-dehydrogenase